MHDGSLDELRHWDALNELAVNCENADLRTDTVWVRVGMDRLDPGLLAGWKIHLSSVPTFLPRLLEQALPVIRAALLPFKVVRTAETLERMNDGRFGLTQVGKAMTIYPPNEEAAYRIADALSAALQGLPGPYIPSDSRFCSSAPVYFRFGAYDARFTVDNLGQELRILAHPERGDVLDTADGEGSPAPRFLPAVSPYDHLAFLRERFLPVQMLQVSAKGAAFLAIDKKTPVGPPLFIKTAKAHTHSDLCGRDALWALEREHGLLRRLAGLPGVPNAGVYESRQGEVAAIVRPYIEGRLWWDVWTCADARTTETRFELQAALRSLAALVRACHERGIVIRDLSPGNIVTF